MAHAFLQGERLYLRPLAGSDAKGRYPEWLNDSAVCRGNSHHVYPYSESKALDYISQVNSADDALVLAVVLKQGDTHIGNVALQAIHWLYRSAEFAILLGEKEAWGKGYGVEAGTLLLAHGFSAVNLNRIACATFSNNPGMRKLALALGMREEGIRRKAAFKSGEYLDVIEYGILRDEFRFPGPTA